MNDITDINGRSSLTGRAKWDDIEDLVKRWARKNPQGFQENMRWVQQDRAEYLMKPDRTLRKGILIHPHLMVYIQQFYPTFMDTNLDVRGFSRRFPNFVVDDGVKPV